MRLNVKILKNVANVNNWQYANQAAVQQGQANEIYVQLVDNDMIPSAEKSIVLPDYPNRYVPQGTVVTLQATFPSINDADQFSVYGTQPFSDDKSIWKFTLTANQLPRSGNMKLVLTEDGNPKNIVASNAISTSLNNVGSC